ncbi:MAG: hypothetical protein ACI8RD_004512 [Bacillariaceae sp.]|jgi:hypothetical protein
MFFPYFFVIDDMTAVGRSHNEKALEVGLQLQIIVRSGTTEAFSKKNVTSQKISSLANEK